MRGLSATDVTRAEGSGKDIFSPVVQVAFQQFIAGYAAYSYGLRTLNQTQKYTIASVDGTVSPGMALVTFNIPNGGIPPNWNYPTRVVISSADKKTLPGLNGHWTIVSGTGATVTIKYAVAGGQKITINCGSIKQEGYSGVSVFNPALSASSHFGTHTSKNPYTNSRGARRAVRIRSLV